MPVRTLKAINLPERERMELGILLSLVGRHDGAAWELTENRRADVAIVDADADAAADAIAEARSVADVVMTISEADTGLCELHVTRPLRTKALTDVLAGLERQTARGARSSRTAPAWALKRWPGTETLRHEWRLTRVCGTLARGPQTVAGIAARTGIDETELERLLTLLSDAGCAAPTEAAVRIAETRPNAPPRGLFGRIRARFGRAST